MNTLSNTSTRQNFMEIKKEITQKQLTPKVNGKHKKETIAFEFSLTIEEWSSVLPPDSTCTSRLHNGWTELLKKKFVEIVPECCIQFNNNRLRKVNSRKMKTAYFRGSGYCTNHDNEYYYLAVNNIPDLSKNDPVVFEMIRCKDWKPSRNRTKLLFDAVKYNPEAVDESGNVDLSAFVCEEEICNEREENKRMRTRSASTPLKPIIHDQTPMDLLDPIDENPNFLQTSVEFPKMGPNESFCLHVNSVLNTLTPHNQVVCRHRLMEVLSEFKFDETGA